MQLSFTSEGTAPRTHPHKRTISQYAGSTKEEGCQIIKSLASYLSRSVRVRARACVSLQQAASLAWHDCCAALTFGMSSLHPGGGGGRGGSGRWPHAAGHATPHVSSS